MRKIFFLLFTSAIFAACGSGSETPAPVDTSAMMKTGDTVKNILDTAAKPLTDTAVK